MMNATVSVTKLAGDTLLPHHAAVLADIMISAWRSAFRGILSDAVIEQYTQKDGCTGMFSYILATGQGHMYLASLGDTPMGLLYWREETPAHAHLEALLTIPDAWGKGIGASLMEVGLQDMAQLGCTTVRVWPFAQNLRAQRFYRKFGFTASGNSRIMDAQEVEYIRHL